MCSKCGAPKHLDEFSLRNRRGKTFYDSRCKKCSSEYASAYNKKHPEDANRRSWESVLWRNYKVTPEQYQKKLALQGGKCIICHSYASGRRFHVDHSHLCCKGHTSCGKCIRGLLCGQCNQFLGLVREDAAVLIRMLDYLASRKIGVDIFLPIAERPSYVFKPRKEAVVTPDAVAGEPQKICSKCWHPKPIPEGFHNNGTHSYCKGCYLDYHGNSFYGGEQAVCFQDANYMVFL